MDNTSQKLIAFYVHAIQLFAEGRSLSYEDLPSEKVHAATGTRTPDAFLNAARSGLSHLLSTLPDEIHRHVIDYVDERLEKVRYTNMDTVIGSMKFPGDVCLSTIPAVYTGDDYDDDTGSGKYTDTLTDSSTDEDYLPYSEGVSVTDMESTNRHGHGTTKYEPDNESVNSFEPPVTYTTFCGIAITNTVIHFIAGFVVGTCIVKLMNLLDITGSL